MQLSPVEKYTPLAAQVRAGKERFLYLEIVDFLFLGEQRSCDGRGGAQRPVWRVNEPKKTDALPTSTIYTYVCVDVKI